MAAAKSLDPEPSATGSAMRFDGFEKILRASRLEAAT
jgi:hypothetical protein